LVRRIDRATVALNLLLLGGTVFIPFATSVLGTYPTMHASTLLYGIVLMWCSTMYNVLLAWLIRRDAFRGGLGGDQIASTVRAYRVGWVGYAVATLLALVYPPAAFAAYLATAAFYLIPHGLDADLAETPSE
jgi:uncharacterized membrane protein